MLLLGVQGYRAGLGHISHPLPVNVYEGNDRWVKMCMYEGNDRWVKMCIYEVLWMDELKHSTRYHYLAICFAI